VVQPGIGHTFQPSHCATSGVRCVVWDFQGLADHVLVFGNLLTDQISPRGSPLLIGHKERDEYPYGQNQSNRRKQVQHFPAPCFSRARLPPMFVVGESVPVETARLGADGRSGPKANADTCDCGAWESTRIFVSHVTVQLIDGRCLSTMTERTSSPIATMPEPILIDNGERRIRCLSSPPWLPIPWFQESLSGRDSSQCR
jgi:hypothetical protein